MKNKKTKIKSIIKQVKNELNSKEFDPYGSWTGKSIDGKRPVQDQDDL